MAEKTTSHVHNNDTAAKPEAPAMPDFFQMFPKMPELFRMPDFGKVPQVAEISAARPIASIRLARSAGVRGVGIMCCVVCSFRS